MTINFFAVKETKHRKYLLDSRCFALWVFADEDPSHTATEYKCHFAGYKVFPNEKLYALLCQQPDGGLDYLNTVEQADPEGEGVGTWTHAEMFLCFDIDANRYNALIRWKEIDWETELEDQDPDECSFEDLLQEEIESAVEHGYPDMDQLRAISEGKTVYGLSKHDFRYIEGCPEITVERPSNGGLLLSYRDENDDLHKQRYFFHTESQARRDFWHYLQEQGVKPEEN